MTIDTPLTCYMCGVTSNDFITVDLIGCLKGSEVHERFKQKFNREPECFLFICSDCRKKNRVYARNIEKKYGVFE